ncbi:MAG: hypothetical protein EBR23_04160 [Planctomycetia bacterium]|nr:hypothetical protein [Planctomycetia bacterium]
MNGPAMPRGLLVSVRDVDEAVEALAGGAAVVDVKDPARGPLGPADAATAAAIGGALGGRVPWTLACGELASAADIVAHLLRVLEHLGPNAVPPIAVKAGPAGLDLAGWQAAQRRMAEALPGGIVAVPVAYADWERACAPTPDGIIDAAAGAGGGMVLIDTFDKSAGGLFEARSTAVVAGWVRKARMAGLGVALAGRLQARHVPLAANLGAHVVAVRSAACDGGRMGRVDSARVRHLGRLLDDGAPRREPLRAGGTAP